MATDTLTKETLPGAAQAAEDSAASAQAQHSHTDAVSAEIRVVVDASQYTAFVRGLSKSVAPLHEETHTVIVFPKGAVIRLTGTLVAGDRLVLTNQQNGLQALCRVVSMKAPAGVKGYAEVEFLQRVPGFWEENPVDEKCEPAVLPAAAPPKLQIVRKDDPVPAAPAEPAKAESKPATAEHAPAPLPFVRVPAAAPAASSDADDLLAAGRKASPKREVLGSRFGFEEASEQTAKPARLRRHWMVAVACVAALAVAAAGVKMMLRHPAATAAAVQQPAASGVNNPPAAPQTQASNKSNAMDAQRVVVTAQVDPQPLAPTAKGTSSQNAAVSKSPAPTQQSKTAAAWRMPIPDGKLVGPAARPNQAAEMKDVAPPTLGADAMPGANGAAAGLVPGGARATAIPAPPAGAPPPTGGRVQSPRLLTSAQPVYPPLAKKQGLEGDVTIEATIDATGQVGGMKVVSGPVALQQAAMDAMRLWKYEPAKLNGLAVSMPTRVIIRFKLH